MVLSDPEAGDGFARVISRPNCSLNWRQTMRFYAWMCVVSIGIALVFAVQGIWMILPLAGAELLALGVALYWVACRTHECEVVSVGPQSIVVERGRTAPRVHLEFPRAWTRLELEPRVNASRSHRLLLRASGRSTELGAFLTNAEREELAGVLRTAMLRPALRDGAQRT